MYRSLGFVSLNLPDGILTQIVGKARRRSEDLQSLEQGPQNLAGLVGLVAGHVEMSDEPDAVGRQRAATDASARQQFGDRGGVASWGFGEQNVGFGFDWNFRPV